MVARCASCGRDITLFGDSTFHRHNVDWSKRSPTCEGSGQPQDHVQDPAKALAAQARRDALLMVAADIDSLIGNADFPKAYDFDDERAKVFAKALEAVQRELRAQARA